MGLVPSGNKPVITCANVDPMLQYGVIMPQGVKTDSISFTDDDCDILLYVTYYLLWNDNCLETFGDFDIDPS